MIAPSRVANAHAGLKSSQPAASSVLEQSPKEVVLKFGEAVEISFGTIRLFDANSKLISLPTSVHESVGGKIESKTVRVDLPDLKPGSIVNEFGL